MKKKNPKMLIIILLITAVTAALASCASSGKAPYGTQSQQSNGASDIDEAKQDIKTDIYEEQLAYYTALVASLQDQLIIIKEESYIDECGYKLQITSLEETISELKDTVSSLMKNSQISHSQGSTAPYTESLSSKPDFKISVNDGAVSITEYIGSSSTVTIPSSIDGMPVVKIGDNAFKGALLTSVSIPSTVKELGWFAFSNCTSLKSITIPSSVSAVGYGAFEQCPKAMVIECEKGSYIEAFALSWGICVDAK